MRKSAFCWLRSEPVYRREAFEAGLARAGYSVHSGGPVGQVRPGDVLLIWNRYLDKHEAATAFEAAGGTVLCAENGYLGMDRGDRRIYAISRHAHNGRGEWYPGGRERFDALKARLGIELAPMNYERSGYVLVAPNRSFGMPGGIMPEGWAQKTAAGLRDARIRSHPGNGSPTVPLEQDLAGASSVHIWSSSVGVEALVRGIPVHCHAPYWICKGWETLGRGAALQRMAWAQWGLEEIESGAAFRHLLLREGQAEVAACA